MKKYLSASLYILFFCLFNCEIAAQKPSISFSFDDGNTADYPGYNNADWNQMILDHLAKHGLKSVLFATGSRLNNPKGKSILNSWDKAGHLIANHTYTHPNFNSEKVSLAQFEAEFLKNDAFISTYQNHAKYFRFPYLKEGNTLEKRDGFRAKLKEKGYRNGHVSIDASDWYIVSRLQNKLKENPKINLDGFRDFYLEHLFERAEYYDQLATELTGRKINHVLLLHHNLTSALFLDDLITYFKNKGWNVTDTEAAYQDEIYAKTLNTLPAGESIIWALAKESGLYEKKLRYPAEDSVYEKDKMDKLGL